MDSRSQNNPWSASGQATETNNVRSFLEDLVQSIRKEIKVNHSEMREFKEDITKQMSQIHQTLPQYQNQTQYHHQVLIDPTVAHNQIQHMQHIQVNQPEGATFHQIPQHHVIMKRHGQN